MLFFFYVYVKFIEKIHLKDFTLDYKWLLFSCILLIHIYIHSPIDYSIFLFNYPVLLLSYLSKL